MPTWPQRSFNLFSNGCFWSSRIDLITCAKCSGWSIERDLSLSKYSLVILCSRASFFRNSGIICLVTKQRIHLRSTVNSSKYTRNSVSNTENQFAALVCSLPSCWVTEFPQAWLYNTLKGSLSFRNCWYNSFASTGTVILQSIQSSTVPNLAAR